MSVKRLDDPHVERMLAEYRRRIGRANDGPLTPRSPAAAKPRRSKSGN